jgi:uncharacterized protein (UPF0147 family)
MTRKSVTNFGRAMVLAILWMSLVSASSFCSAQQPDEGFREIPVPAEVLDDTPAGKKQRMDRERQAIDILRSETWPLDPQRRSELDTWIRIHRFAVLTRRTHLPQWVDAREDFTKRLLAQIRTPQMRDHVIGVTRQVTEAITRGNFHPAARYNAMLLLGHLNTSDAVTFGDRRPEVPMIEVLRFMLDELANPQQIDAVRVAALNGILRHVKIDRDLPDGSRRLVGNAAETMIVNSMLNLLDAKQPPEGRSAEAHVWMQRRAADVLGMLGSVGQGNRVVTALEQIVADDDLPVNLRCSASDALGQLNYPANPNINAVAIAKRLGAVAVLACYEEIKRVEDQKARDEARKKRPPGAGGMPYGGDMYGGDMYGGGEEMYGGADMYGGSDMYGGMDMYGGDMYGEDMYGPSGPSAKPKKKPRGPLDYRIDDTRRQVKDQLLQVKRGLTGHDRYATKGLLALTAAGNGQQEVQTLIARLDDIVAVVDPPMAAASPSVKAPKAVAPLRDIADPLRDMDALVKEIRTKVQKMEADCGIVVEIPADELTLPDDLDMVPDSLPDGLPDLPLGPPGDEQPPVDEPVDPEMPVDTDEPVDPSELMEPEAPEMPAEPSEEPAEPGDN